MAMGLGDKCLAKRLVECEQTGETGIPRPELLRYMQGAAKGLDYLHSPVHVLEDVKVAIIHRDIKPHNILVVGDEAQICDFGLARAVATFQAMRSRTQTLTGTEGYIAPEILLDSRPATALSDQYSLAISYIVLRTSRMPYGTGSRFSPGDVLRAHWDEGLNLSMLERGERRVVAKATSSDPKNRFTNCSEFVEELRRADNNKSTTQWLADFGALLRRRQANSARKNAAEAGQMARGGTTSVGVAPTPAPEDSEPSEEFPNHPLNTANTTVLSLDPTLSEFSEGSLATEFDYDKPTTDPDKKSKADRGKKPVKRDKTATQSRRRVWLVLYSILITAAVGFQIKLILSIVFGIHGTAPTTDQLDPQALANEWRTQIAKKLNDADYEGASDEFDRVPEHIPEAMRRETIALAADAWLAALDEQLAVPNTVVAKKLVELAPPQMYGGETTLQQRAVGRWYDTFTDCLEGTLDLVLAGEMLQNAPQVNSPGEDQRLVNTLLEQWKEKYRSCLTGNRIYDASRLLEELASAPIPDRDMLPLVDSFLKLWGTEHNSCLTNGNYLHAGRLIEEFAGLLVEEGQIESRVDALLMNWSREFDVLLERNDVSSASDLLANLRRLSLDDRQTKIISQMQARLPDPARSE